MTGIICANIFTGDFAIIDTFNEIIIIIIDRFNFYLIQYRQIQSNQLQYFYVYIIIFICERGSFTVCDKQFLVGIWTKIVGK
jgi:hypothetical protein